MTEETKNNEELYEEYLKKKAPFWLEYTDALTPLTVEFNKKEEKFTRDKAKYQKKRAVLKQQFDDAIASFREEYFNLTGNKEGDILNNLTKRGSK